MTVFCEGAETRTMVWLTFHFSMVAHEVGVWVIFEVLVFYEVEMSDLHSASYLSLTICGSQSGSDNKRKSDNLYVAVRKRHTLNIVKYYDNSIT